MKYLLIVLSLTIFVVGKVFADNNQQPLDTNIFQSQGLTYSIDGDQVTININQEKILAAIPNMQAMGALNPDITQYAINMNPTLYSSIVGLYLTTAIVEDIYKNSNYDTLHYKAFLLRSDDYGNEQKHLIYSFSFSRKLNNKINWDNMDASKFMKIAPAFRYTSWYYNKIENGV